MLTLTAESGWQVKIRVSDAYGVASELKGRTQQLQVDPFRDDCVNVWGLFESEKW